MQWIRKTKSSRTMTKMQCLSQMHLSILMPSHALAKPQTLTCKLQLVKGVKKVNTHIESRRQQKKLLTDKRPRDGMRSSRCSNELTKQLWSKSAWNQNSNLEKVQFKKFTSSHCFKDSAKIGTWMLSTGVNHFQSMLMMKVKATVKMKESSLKTSI